MMLSWRLDNSSWFPCCAVLFFAVMSIADYCRLNVQRMDPSDFFFPISSRATKLTRECARTRKQRHQHFNNTRPSLSKSFKTNPPYVPTIEWRSFCLLLLVSHTHIISNAQPESTASAQSIASEDEVQHHGGRGTSKSSR
jgi:hypothetical protein